MPRSHSPVLRWIARNFAFFRDLQYRTHSVSARTREFKSLPRRFLFFNNMDKKEWKRTSELIVVSFIGASMAVFLQKLIDNYTNWGAWIGFTISMVVLFLIAHYILKSLNYQYKQIK